jgi:hypothetical protein
MIQTVSKLTGKMLSSFGLFCICLLSWLFVATTEKNDGDRLTVGAIR